MYFLPVSESVSSLLVCKPGYHVDWQESELVLFLNLAVLVRVQDKGEIDRAASWLWKINIFVQKAPFLKTFVVFGHHSLKNWFQPLEEFNKTTSFRINT